MKKTKRRPGRKNRIRTKSIYDTMHFDLEDLLELDEEEAFRRDDADEIEDEPEEEEPEEEPIEDLAESPDAGDYDRPGTEETLTEEPEKPIVSGEEEDLLTEEQVRDFTQKFDKLPEDISDLEEEEPEPEPEEYDAYEEDRYDRGARRKARDAADEEDEYDGYDGYDDDEEEDEEDEWEKLAIDDDDHAVKKKTGRSGRRQPLHRGPARRGRAGHGHRPAKRADRDGRSDRERRSEKEPEKKRDKLTAAEWLAIAMSLILVIAAVSLGIYFVSVQKKNAELAAFQEIGADLAGVRIIGESGLIAMRDESAIRLAAAEEAEAAAQEEVIEVVEEEEEVELPEVLAEIVEINMSLTSIKSDLKIKFINSKTGKLIASVPFEVTAKAPDGKADVWRDDDMDGIIYRKDIAAGVWSVTMSELDEKYAAEYVIGTNVQTAKVKDNIEYKKVDVKEEIKKESEVNVAVEDTEPKEATTVESVNVDTVEWVESSREEFETGEEGFIYEEVPKGDLTVPNTTAALSRRRARGVGRMLPADEPGEPDASAGAGNTDQAAESASAGEGSGAAGTTAEGAAAASTETGASTAEAASTVQASEPAAPSAGTTEASSESSSAAAPESSASASTTEDSSAAASTVAAPESSTAASTAAAPDSSTAASTAAAPDSSTAASTAAVPDSSTAGTTAVSDSSTAGSGAASSLSTTGSSANVSATGSSATGATAATSASTAASTASSLASTAQVIDKKVILSTNSVSMLAGGSVALTVSTENLSDREVIFLSSDPDIATVTDDGVIKAMAAGTVTITVVSAEDSSVKDTCTVTVTSGGVLKTVKGETVYVKDGDTFREATEADYNTASVFYRKTTAKKYIYHGWQTIDGLTYYFDRDGNYVTGEQTILGIKYKFSSEGVLASGSGELGIDVSKWNGSINWTAVKNSGVSYAIIRCGYRGTSSGALIEDPSFRTNMKGALNAGLKVGVYFFSAAVNEIEAIEEASMAASLCSGYKLTYPVFLDVERSGSGNGRADRISAADRTAVIRAFCATMANSGYRTGVYANKNWLEEMIDTPSLTGYKIWLAQYAATPSYGRTRYDMWQYTSKGTIGGISGSVDLNISYMSY